MVEYTPRYFPMLYYVAGLLIYLFSSAVFWFIESFSDYLSTLNTLGVISLVVAFWFLSQANMKKGSLPGKKETKLSRAVVVQNGIWLGVFLGLIFLSIAWQNSRRISQVKLSVDRFIDWLQDISLGCSVPFVKQSRIYRLGKSGYAYT